MPADTYELNDETIANARKSIHRLMDKLISLEIDEIETYDFPVNEAFGLEVICDNTPFYLIIKFSKSNKNLICFAPGASERHEKTSEGDLKIPPFFSRWKWHKYFDESTITFADPMLFLGDEMKLGWLIGTKDHWHLETVSRIIEKLAINQNVSSDNILFYGSSGGGFVSLCLAALIRNSKVLVNNAQFFVLNYHPRLVNLALDATVPSFEGLSKEQVIEKIRYRLDVPELYKKQNYAPYITYYVNVKSEFDMTTQAMPLVSKYYEMDVFNGLDIIYYSKASKTPHNPLPNNISINIIKSFAKKNLYNSTSKSSKELFEDNLTGRNFAQEFNPKKQDKPKNDAKIEKNKLGKLKRLFK